MSDRHFSLSAERLQELLSYDPATGVFRWRVKRGSVKVGDIAGHAGPISTKGRGHAVRIITVDGVSYQAHHLAWLYVHKVWPTGKILHVNGYRLDNRIDNLFETKDVQDPDADVFWSARTNKWHARLYTSPGRYKTGRYRTEQEALQAYECALRFCHPPMTNVIRRTNPANVEVAR